jgi:hypothetical protein
LAVGELAPGVERRDVADHVGAIDRLPDLSVLAQVGAPEGDAGNPGIDDVDGDDFAAPQEFAT